MPQIVSANFIAGQDGKYEPQRTNQFALRVVPPGFGGSEDILCRAVRAMPFPAIDIEPISIEFVNEVRFVAGRHKQSPIEITLYDFLGEQSVEEMLWEWIKLVYNPTPGPDEGKIGLAKDYKVEEAELIKFDPGGNQERRWILVNVWPCKWTPGKGDMATSDKMLMDVTFQCDKFYRDSQ